MRTWEDVRRALTGYLWTKFPRAKREDIEDAVASAMLDLVDYWVHLPSSISNDANRNWRFALQRGKWESVKFLMFRFEELRSETSLLSEHDDEDGEEGWSFIDSLADPGPGPEDIVCDRDEMERFQGFLDEAVSDSEEAGWLPGYLRGERCEDTRSRSRATAYRHQARDISRLARKACTYGVVR